jgi:hypothetical protein
MAKAWTNIALADGDVTKFAPEELKTAKRARISADTKGQQHAT